MTVTFFVAAIFILPYCLIEVCFCLLHFLKNLLQ